MPQALTPQVASRFARIVLAGIEREFPNKLDHVMNDAGEVLSPRALHPAFYGCFDWHSSVHGHWLLVRLLRMFPDLAESTEARRVLGRHLTPENIRVETAYLARPNSGSFERTYGWAWLLRLAEEIGRAAAAGEGALAREARAWSAALAPLARAFVGRYLAYLPRAEYPIRAGVHPNTAFGLSFAHDYAVFVGHAELRELVEAKAAAFFGADRDYAAHLEPGGADFFSPALMEADLMRRILPRGEGPGSFASWFRAFLPGAAAGKPANLFSPASVSDRADLQIVHLDGLNLSRAWCMRSIAAALPAGDPARAAMEASAEVHAAAALPHVCSGDYGGEHWLATFAVLALAGAS